MAGQKEVEVRWADHSGESSAGTTGRRQRPHRSRGNRYPLNRTGNIGCPRLRRGARLPEGPERCASRCSKTPLWAAAHVGAQIGGRVALFLHTDDFWGDYRCMQAHDVRFVEAPRKERHGRVVVFRDLYGNKWDLTQLNAA